MDGRLEDSGLETGTEFPKPTVKWTTDAIDGEEEEEEEEEEKRTGGKKKMEKTKKEHKEE